MKTRPLARFQAEKRDPGGQKGNGEYDLRMSETNCLLRDCLKILLFIWYPEIKLWVLNISQLKTGL